MGEEGYGRPFTEAHRAEVERRFAAELPELAGRTRIHLDGGDLCIDVGGPLSLEEECRVNAFDVRISDVLARRPSTR